MSIVVVCRNHEPDPSRRQHGQHRTRNSRVSPGIAKVEVDGRRINVMVDTGATTVALTYEDARSIGLSLRDSDFTMRVSTANGYGRVAPVTLDRVSIGDITVRNVRGAVMEPGKLGTTLLGMSFLGRLQRVDMRAGTLVLHE
jgi:aspartyl protease family protein